jgi:hypothetical protein
MKCAFTLQSALPIFLLLIVLLPSPVAARTVYRSADGTYSVRLAGYVKTLALGLNQYLPGTEDTAEDFTRARLMLEGTLGTHLSWTVHYEHFAVINQAGPASTDLFIGSNSTERFSLLPLDWTVKETPSFLWRHEFDRLNVRASFPTVDVVVGRQAISWGVGRFWNPFDLFNAFSPVEIDREYKSGVDAVRLEWALGSFSQLEAVYAAFADDFRYQSVAVRGRKTIGNVDVGGMTGKFFRDFVIGPFVDGEINGVGARGELTFTHDTTEKGQGRRTFVRGVSSIDYRFANGLYTLLEYYFNGFGETDPATYLKLFPLERVTRGEIFNFGRHYLGALLQYEFHPLVQGDLFAQWNLRDQSALIAPLLAVSLSDEADMRLGAYFPIGTGLVGSQIQSEFGLYPQVYYLELRLYF